jgi:hypothetical protein
MIHVCHSLLKCAASFELLSEFCVLFCMKCCYVRDVYDDGCGCGGCGAVQVPAWPQPKLFSLALQ